jgi:iron complex outermembrane recepter protein
VRSKTRSCLTAILAAGLLAASLAQAQTTAFDLPEQPLADSLRALAAQTHSNILFDRNLVAGISARRLKAELNLTQALEALLEGTGLTHQSSDDRTVLIVPARAGGMDDRVQRYGTEQPYALEEVVVTAQKRTERLKDVPAAVSVLGSRQMLQSHQTRLVDYAATIPGLQVESSAPGRSTLTLRGLALHGDGATVGTYIDDVPFGSSAGGRNFALELLPYDLERIEVLRGPQGTFYGANALGGLLKYVTKAPDLYERQLSAGMDALAVANGDDAGYVVRAGGNTPLIDGKLAVRASYGFDHTPGYLDIPARRRRDVNETDRQTGNLAMLWQASDRLSVKLGGLVEQIDSPDNVLVRLDLPGKRPAIGDLAGVSALAQPFKRTLQLYSATLKYDFGWSELTAVSSFASSTTTLRTDATTTYGPIVTLLSGGTVESPLAPLDAQFDLRKYTQELRLATPTGGRFEGMLGAFFTYEDAPVTRQMIAALDADGTPLAGLSPLVAVDTPTNYREAAVFTNATYQLTDRLDVSAGVRLARNEQKLTSLISGPLFPSDETRARSSESVFNYSLAPRFRLDEDTMLYLRIATGYRPGGPNIVLNPQAGVPSEFKSDRITNYELGVKSALLDRRVELNVAVFQIDWDDVQIGLVDFSTGTGYFDNGKAARSRGIEWESVYSPAPSWRFELAATWIDAVLTEDLPANSTLTGAAGDRLPSAPRFSGALTANYSFPISATWSGVFGGTYRYVGNRYTGLSGDPNTLQLDQYSTVDLNLGVADRSWSVNLFVRNLMDRRAYVQQDLFVDLATNEALAIEAAPVQPRTFGLSVDKKF